MRARPCDTCKLQKWADERGVTCSHYRTCKRYVEWVKETWHEVVAPFRRIRDGIKKDKSTNEDTNE